jgi:DNA polymerase-1
MGPFGLARQLRISNANAKAAIDRYFDHYHGVRNFIDRTIEETRRRGFSQTLSGRKRMIPELASRNRTIRQQGERLAVNTTLQGTAADLIKKAMIDIEQALTERRLRTAMLLQVHDELIFEVPLEELEQTKTLVQEKMEKVWALSVPLEVDLGWGENWM